MDNIENKTIENKEVLQYEMKQFLIEVRKCFEIEGLFIKEKIDKVKYTKGYKQMATTLGNQIKDNCQLNVNNMIELMRQRAIELQEKCRDIWHFE